MRLTRSVSGSASQPDVPTRCLTNPSDFTQNPPGCPDTNTVDGTPVSRHTYGGIVYLPVQDKMFSFGGALAPCGGPWSARTYTLDLLQGHSYVAARWIQSTDIIRCLELPGHLFAVCGYDPNTQTVITCSSSGVPSSGTIRPPIPIRSFPPITLLSRSPMRLLGRSTPSGSFLSLWVPRTKARLLTLLRSISLRAVPSQRRTGVRKSRAAPPRRRSQLSGTNLRFRIGPYRRVAECG